MHLTAAQFIQLCQRKLCRRIGDGADGKRHQNLIGMQARIVIAEVLDLELQRIERLYRTAKEAMNNGN